MAGKGGRLCLRSLCEPHAFPLWTPPEAWWALARKPFKVTHIYKILIIMTVYMASSSGFQELLLSQLPILTQIVTKI